MSAATHRRSWAVAGGGTGGHVTPALALAERIATRGDSVFLLGSDRGLETTLVPEAGFDLAALPSRQVMGQGVLARLGAAVAMARGSVAALRILRQRQATIVVSVGGYASVPAVLAALLLRLPFVLVEPNAHPGRANRAVARFARRIFVQFEAAGAVLAPGDERVSAPGIPLRRALVAAFADAPPRRPPELPYRLLVFGGSQGARQINEAMLEAAPELHTLGLRIFHQTGSADRERVRAAYAQAGLDAEVVDFERDMPRRYHEADLALCRAGALTVGELTMAGLPALLVPYPFAADDHQAANARALVEAGAARVLPSRPLTGADVVRSIDALLASPETLRSMSAAAAKLARPDAAERIIEACAELLDAAEGA
jgi:UDP-N-acetylglucosamine--N-acetylmuramyl-(pentapeptide) pyrophosphoryl-undecaprenol N-acetylglucosamine transferase